jgi:hypothetical protein
MRKAPGKIRLAFARRALRDFLHILAMDGDDRLACGWLGFLLVLVVNTNRSDGLASALRRLPALVDRLPDLVSGGFHE